MSLEHNPGKEAAVRGDEDAVHGFEERADRHKVLDNASDDPGAHQCDHVRDLTAPDAALAIRVPTVEREPHRVRATPGRPVQSVQLQEHSQATCQPSMRNQDIQEIEGLTVLIRLPAGIGLEPGAAVLGLQSKGGNLALDGQP